MESSIKSMFFFLSDPKFKKKYDGYRRQRLLGLVYLQILVTLGISFTTLFYLVRTLLTNENYTHLKIEVVWFLIFLISGFSIFTLIIGYFLHWRRKIYSDRILFISNIYLLVVLYELRNQTQDPLYYFWWAFRFGTLNLMYLLIYKAWPFKAVQIVFTVVYFHSRQAVFILDESIFFNAALSVGAAVFLFFQEKMERQAFQTIYHSNREKKAWKRFVNILPEGVAIFRKDMSQLFVNKSLKEILGAEDKDELTRRLFDLRKKVKIRRENPKKINRVPQDDASQLSSNNEDNSPELVEIGKLIVFI
jgi:PAS domain-containing protein